jgi:hypothetical protein
MYRRYPLGFVIVDLLVCDVERTEDDDDDVDMSFAARFALPLECAVSKVDLNLIFLKQLVPQNPNLFTLAD